MCHYANLRLGLGIIKSTPICLRLSHALASTCVPKHLPATDEDVDSLLKFLTNSSRLVVLSGAGISTESGIPDYRSESVGLYAKSNHKPVQYKDFLNSPSIQQRYWARNYVGWPNFSRRQPNTTHHVISSLQSAGKVIAVITQNVDSLHSKAGSLDVLELHGTAYRVLCLSCGKQYDRHYVQEIISKLNPHMRETSKMIRPDGDVEISAEAERNFKAPRCEHCEGVLKPDIVFFGDNVPQTRVNCVKDFVSKSDSLLVLGSSLSVFSGYRIILQAFEERKKICIVNIGPTRGDKHATLKIAARCGDILSRLDMNSQCIV